jgi:hypothetical protein
MGGMGGSGGMGGAGGSAPAYTISSVAAAFAFDVTPNPDANVLFFTGIGANGQAGVFKVAVGSGDVDPLVTGAPFVAPFGIAINTTGSALFVTDLGADDPMAGTDAGHIFEVTTAAAVVTPVPGSAAVLPRGVEIFQDAQAAEHIIFTGIDVIDGRPGVFDLPVDGGTPTVIAKGAPFADPSGVAVTATGEVYVCDTLSNPDRTATVFVVEQGIVNEVVKGLHIGYPCGIALTRDDSKLLAVTRGATTGTDQVLVVDLKTKSTATLTANIDAYNEPAGMHRAKNVDVFAFTDSKAEGTGMLFLMQE